MKSRNITFSMPIELINKLQSITRKRQLSKFVVRALEKAIEEENQSLRAAYIAAEQDEDRLKTIQEWSVLDFEDWDE